jgi:hypothetical protein
MDKIIKLLAISSIVISLTNAKEIYTAFTIEAQKSANLASRLFPWSSLDGDESRYEGRITKIYPYANSNNRKIRAEVLARGFVSGLFGDGYNHISEAIGADL